MAKKEISLMPEKNAVEAVANKLVNWILSVGRYIVVFTELIVIGAFLSRFWLDRKNSDLSEKIRQQKAILSSTQSFEQEFHLFQKRMRTIKKNFKEKRELLDPLNVIVRNMPSDVLLTKYSFSGVEEGIRVSLHSQVFSEAGLAEFIDRLIEEETVQSVKVGAIEKEIGKGGMSIEFLVNFKYNNGDNNNS